MDSENNTVQLLQEDSVQLTQIEPYQPHLNNIQSQYIHKQSHLIHEQHSQDHRVNDSEMVTFTHTSSSHLLQNF